jgi:hypothetical protein
MVSKSRDRGSKEHINRERHSLRHRSIFPPDFIEETLQTMSLLLPSFDRKDREWFRRVQARARLDPNAGSQDYLKVEARKIEHYKYWRDRIIILKEVYDEHEPQGIIQFWRDDRRQIQWWTFWIAAVVFLVAIIQCVEGAIQVYKAYHPS